MRVSGAEEVMVVSVDEGYVFWFFGVWRDGGEVNAVDLSSGECASETVSDGASATAYVEDTGRIFDGRMEDFARHDLLNKFMLAIESLILAWADTY